MKRFFHSLVALAIGAILLAVGLAHAAVDNAKQVYHAATQWVVTTVSGALELAGSGQMERTPQVRIVQAKAFVQRIVKRERPVVTASWRACPSI